MRRVAVSLVLLLGGCVSAFAPSPTTKPSHTHAVVNVCRGRRQQQGLFFNIRNLVSPPPVDEERRDKTSRKPTYQLQPSRKPSILPPSSSASTKKTYNIVAVSDSNDEKDSNGFNKFLNNIQDAMAQRAKQMADAALEEVKSIPTKVSSAAAKKLEETQQYVVDEIKAAPGRIGDAASRKARETSDYIAGEVQAIPTKITSAATDAAQKTVKSIEEKVDETVGEFKAAPMRLVDGTKKVVNDTKEEISKSVSKVLPLSSPVPSSSSSLQLNTDKTEKK